MKVPARALDHPLVGRIERSKQHELIYREGLDSLIYIKVDSIKLAHHGDEQQFRPYVRIKGELQSVTPPRRLPGAITEITYPEGSRPNIDAKYEFIDEQLIEMIQNGYYEEGYDFVDAVKNVTLELNALVDYKISREYDDKGLDVPIAFVDVKDRASLSYDMDSSGYDFVEYMKVPEKHLDLEHVAEYGSLEVSHDMFAELNAEYEREESLAPQVDVHAHLRGDDDYEREHEETLREIHESLPHPEPEVDQSKSEYDQFVRPTLEASVNAVKAPEPSVDDDFDDDYEDESSHVPQIDLGMAGPNPHLPKSEPVHEGGSVSVPAPSVDDSYLFADADEPVEEIDERVEHAHDIERDDHDPDSDESKSKIARMLMEHEARERAAAEARHHPNKSKHSGPDL